MALLHSFLPPPPTLPSLLRRSDLVSARQQVTRISAAPSEAAVEDLRQWLRESGAAPSSAAVRPALVPEGLGLVAQRDISRNEAVVEVPKRLWIDAGAVAASDIGGVCGGLKPWVSVALFLLRERAAGPESSWKPYLDVLPPDTDSTIFWSEEELSEIQVELEMGKDSKQKESGGKGKGKMSAGGGEENASKGKGKAGKSADGLGTCTYVKARHILCEKQGKANDAYKKLQDGWLSNGDKVPPAEFAKVAAEYSECPSGKKGGDLGWFPRGKMAGPFQDVAFSTPIGATSAPFKSTHGYHVILCEGRKN